jgi:hypothetical protein
MSQHTRGPQAPIFLIGMPRSGTSIVFGAFAAHEDLGWFSHYMNRFPAVPALALLGRLASLAPGTRKAVPRHGDPRRLVDRMKIAPTEAYGVWSRYCGEKFPLGYLLDVEATPTEARRVRRRVTTTTTLQGKPRFVAKLTGPGRIGYISSIFPDARFVHVIRDPRAVVDSLLRVPFWRDTYRRDQPAWRGGLSEQDVAAWERFGTPEALAAVQWGAVLRHTREEARRRDPRLYTEVRYEDFIAEPHETLTAMFAFADLHDDPGAHRFVDERLAVRDLRAGWRRRLSEEQVAVISTLLSEPMGELGYEDAVPAGEARVSAAEPPTS